MTKEHRRSVRRTIQHKSAILNDDGSILANCTMMDVSAHGAKIATLEKTEIPDEFVLLLAKGGKVRRKCKVAWRRQNEVGVKFVVTPQKTSRRI
jgi:PilZ domain